MMKGPMCRGVAGSDLQNDHLDYGENEELKQSKTEVRETVKSFCYSP